MMIRKAYLSILLALNATHCPEGARADRLENLVVILRRHAACIDVFGLIYTSLCSHQFTSRDKFMVSEISNSCYDRACEQCRHMT